MGGQRLRQNRRVVIAPSWQRAAALAIGRAESQGPTAGWRRRWRSRAEFETVKVVSIDGGAAAIIIAERALFVHAARKPQVARRGADQEVVAAGRNDPRMGRAVPMLKRARLEPDARVPGGSGGHRQL